jgi:hypothetical protein
MRCADDLPLWERNTKRRVPRLSTLREGVFCVEACGAQVVQRGRPTPVEVETFLLEVDRGARGVVSTIRLACGQKEPVCRYFASTHSRIRTGDLLRERVGARVAGCGPLRGNACKCRLALKREGSFGCLVRRGALPSGFHRAWATTGSAPASGCALSAVERGARKQEAAGDQARARQSIDADFRCGRRLRLVGPQAVWRAMPGA